MLLLQKSFIMMSLVVIFIAILNFPITAAVPLSR